MLVGYLGVNPGEAMMELKATRGAHSRFRCLEKVYKQQLLNVVQGVGDAEQVVHYKVRAIRAFMLYSSEHL